MSLVQRQRVAVAAAAFIAVTAPSALLGSRSAPPPPPPPPPMVTPLVVSPVPELAMARAAPIFSPDRSAPASGGAPAPQAEPATPEPPPPAAPALAGLVVGPRGKSVVLLRNAAGETVTAAVGDLVDQWRVAAIGRDAATLERAGERKQARLDFSNRGSGGGGGAVAAPPPAPLPAPPPIPAPPGGAPGFQS